MKSIMDLCSFEHFRYSPTFWCPFLSYRCSPNRPPFLFPLSSFSSLFSPSPLRSSLLSPISSHLHKSPSIRYSTRLIMNSLRLLNGDMHTMLPVLVRPMKNPTSDFLRVRLKLSGRLSSSLSPS